MSRSVQRIVPPDTTIAKKKLYQSTSGTLVDTISPLDNIDDHEITERRPVVAKRATFWKTWLGAFKQVFPVYMATHIVFFLLTCLSFLYTINDVVIPRVSEQHTSFKTMLKLWQHWDAGHYIHISAYGYTEEWRTAFFPLFPLCINVLTMVTHNALVSGLLIADLAGLFLFVVLYQLVLEDFNQQVASRTVLYLALFPTAFFLAAVYTESLFLCLSLLCFYCLRHEKWWLAGIFGFCASLTRSAGLFLVLPFCYEYLRQRQFKLKKVDISLLSLSLVPAGVGSFALYCYFRFHDLLAFSHAQVYWDRQFQFPWWAIENALITILHHSSGIVSYISVHNLLELLPVLCTLFLLVLSIVGPWRFPRTHRAYWIYASALFLFIQLAPVNWSDYPLQSYGRYMLELFPAFIVLAVLGKYRTLHINYLIISGAILFFLLTQYLLGHWIV